MVCAAYIDDDEAEPIHMMFGLTRSNYLVMQRTLMEAMPRDWQHRFVAVLAELQTTFDTDQLAVANYRVQAIDAKGRFVKDPLANYRHPDQDFIDSLRLRRDS